MFRVRGGTPTAVYSLLISFPLMYGPLIWGLRRWWKATGRLVVWHVDIFINHRRTRTGFANARLDSEWRKRKRVASVLVCGSSHKEHKGHKGRDAPRRVRSRMGILPVPACFFCRKERKDCKGRDALCRVHSFAAPMRRVRTRALPHDRRHPTAATWSRRSAPIPLSFA